ncbi:MAG: YdcF family protein [Vicingaceae bacterium]
MFFILSKILSFLISPLVWGLGLLLWSFLSKNSRRKRRLLWGAFIILYLFSNQAIFHEISNAWEAEPKKIQQLKEHYDIAVVLGGILSIDHQYKQIEFNKNADRILNVLPLYFDGRVDKILISGGSGRIFKDGIEANVLQSYLLDIGVANEDIITERKSQNTFENAKYSVEIIKELGLDGSVLLSTSTTHMKRSVMCFKKQGLEVDSFPVDQVSYKRELNPYTLLVPQADVLGSWYWLIHEWVGILIYKIMGYC